MNTTSDVTLAPARADELAGLLDGLLHWLSCGDQRALADLEAHLGDHAARHGGTFDSNSYLDGTDSVLQMFTTLIAAYSAELDRPDSDDGDYRW